MGTVNATLLFAVPNTNWVNATFLWVTSQVVKLAKLRHPGGCVLFLQRAASLLLPGES